MGEDWDSGSGKAGGTFPLSGNQQSRDPTRLTELTLVGHVVKALELFNKTGFFSRDKTRKFKCYS